MELGQRPFNSTLNGDSNSIQISDLATFLYDSFVLVVKIHHFYHVMFLILFKLASCDE